MEEFRRKVWTEGRRDNIQATPRDAEYPEEENDVKQKQETRNYALGSLSQTRRKFIQEGRKKKEKKSFQIKAQMSGQQKDRDFVAFAI